MHQKLVFKNTAQKQLLAGAKQLADAVSSTMGPSGHSVIIDSEEGSPSITKDGVTVAKSINLKERLPSMGAELLKEVASKTNDVAGDGPQPLYAKVLTPSGWRTMGSLKEGEEICGTNNTIQKVVGVYPKGTKKIVRITTSDNRIVECCEEHLWRVKTYYGKEKVLTAKELMENNLFTTDSNGKRRTKYFLPITSVEFKENKKLPLDPYFVGTLLGDGCLSPGERGSIDLSIGFKEEFVLEKIKLPENCSFVKTYDHKKNYIRARINGSENGKSIIKEHLLGLELLNTNSHTKFIPKLYLYSSRKNRKKLLNGLIDTDGHINNRGRFEYRTVSKQLYLDVLELCRSLGIQTCSYISTRKENSDSYSTNPIYKICELKGYKHGIKIKNIETVDKKTEMQCIKVSNEDSLYITNDYTVTHNTTTATVLAYNLLREGHKMISTGHSSIKLKEGISEATKIVLNFLKDNKTSVVDKQDIINVGTISANGDKTIGDLIANAIESVGNDGLIAVEPAKSVKTTLKISEGIQIDKGFLSPYFITNNSKQICELEDPYVLITTGKISTLQDIVPVLEQIEKSGRPILIVADDVEGEAMHALTVNHTKQIIKVCAIKAPGYGEYRNDILNDLSVVVGGEVLGVSSELSLKNVKLDDMGTCKKVIVNRKNTTFIVEPTEEKSEKIKNRAESIKNAMITDTTLDDLRLSKYRERLARLSGGVAIIQVGGSTEVEIREKKDRVEDAVHATQAATQEGIVPGGGTALYYAAQHLKGMIKAGFFSDRHEDVIAGVAVLANVCETPFKTIVENTGVSSEVVGNKLIENWNETANFSIDLSRIEDWTEQEIKEFIDNLKEKHSFKICENLINNIKNENKDEEYYNSKEYRDNVVAKFPQERKFRFGYNAANGEYNDLVSEGIIDPCKVTRFALENAASLIGLMLTCNAVIVNEEDEND